MRPIQHTTSNDVLRAPPGMSHDECRPLYITRVIYRHSGKEVPGIISYWQPTPEQLALLNAGKPVFLSVIGVVHPPVSIGVEGDGLLDLRAD